MARLKPPSTPRGAWLRRERLERGWSQRVLAQESGIPKRTLSSLESGPRTRSWTLDEAHALAVAFGVPLATVWDAAGEGTMQIDTYGVRLSDLSPEEHDLIRRLRPLHLSRGQYRALSALAEAFAVPPAPPSSLPGPAPSPDGQESGP
jgi:transcriptional regulator with XRE-family HTH domain